MSFYYPSHTYFRYDSVILFIENPRRNDSDYLKGYIWYNHYTNRFFISIEAKPGVTFQTEIFGPDVADNFYIDEPIKTVLKKISDYLGVKYTFLRKCKQTIEDKLIYLHLGILRCPGMLRATLLDQENKLKQSKCKNYVV